MTWRIAIERMKRSNATRWLVLLSCLHTAGSAAAVLESLHESDYEVSVNERQSLPAALNAASPFHEGSRVFHGNTKWHVRWQFRWIENGGSCRINSTQVDVSADITLPRLAGGSGAQRAAFDRYVAALKQHEMGHYQLGREAASAIDQRLAGLPPTASCTLLEKSANDAANQLLDTYREKERRYDAETDHGKTQGARLVM